ncbi:phosphoenolpyruvate--protein phosphotransferase [Vibrio hangzhouensis]|uniref:Phosphocarrier protein HPr/phosphoenolpyruvate--protein phosphotransferase n=1 Tax=Vibrio hangzhouensis TaxID=462991 RepID=A0A1H5X2X2_9VIBR|nr:phosphoenolpyruvate--protein phosphotransferase [Vibrio hangzhouensis]SEG05725.1 Phosphocarrier protein HPr/phosphoenolpyruvate--protein phosphotransferase [Vibrio hangzhouensis]
MVGIVVVSHSRLLAEGVAELATQMTQGKANLAIAAGVDDPENPIGTDAIAVMGAIEEVCDQDGVVVLMDLGSALLSTEMALELLDDDTRERVALVSAPIVEGTMAASVAAAAGLPIEAVIAEATSALDVKKEHLGEEVAVEAPQESGTADVSAEALSFQWLVKNPHGIHARPAAAIVGCLAPFSSDVQLEKAGQKVSAKSLNSIAKLGVRCDESIVFYASGHDAEQAVAAFTQLANQHFGEAEQVAKGVQTEPEQPEEAVIANEIDGALAGISVNGGIVTAPAVIFTQEMPAVPGRDFTDADKETAKVREAIAEVKAHLEAQSKLPHGEIFAAHAMMLADPEIAAKVEAEIAEQVIAEQAWFDVMMALAEQYKSAESQYMREREADVYDICRQVMIALTGETPKAITINQPSVLLARDLMPSDVAGLDKSKVVAICLSEGGKTSHSAILARAMGIPAVVKVQGCLEQVNVGDEITVDGFSGLLWFAPSEATKEELASKRHEWLAAQELALQNAQSQAVTQDGIEIHALANIGGPEDVEAALANGAEGVGLFRTEFLFQESDELPTEDEQYAVYKQIAAAFGDKPITIRSLDVGGDKPLAAYPMPEEENPFLGQRGVRLCLKHEELFATQLRAILRAHAEQPNIQLMIPMIANVAEVRAVKALIAKQRTQLGMADTALPVGIMIEVPAAVFNADALAQEVDFFSIGTNDLTQYVMAADRGNTEVAELVNYFEPAVIKAIELTIQSANKAGISVSMCGEMAGDVKATELLLKLGLRKFSASSTLLPTLKQQVRALELVTS